MRVTLATEPAKPDRPNEDFAAASSDALVLLDGAGTPAGSESGCIHGVAWYARTLGGVLLGKITGNDVPLADALGDAIAHVRSLHADTCDLAHPGSPSATVIAVRVRAGVLSYLVLADSVLVLDRAGEGPEVVTDDREAEVGRELRKPMDALPADTPEHEEARRAYMEALWSSRNRTGGFWVASADPEAAGHALVGSVPVDDLSSVAVLSDGASRMADRFGLMSWEELVKVLESAGPDELIARTREAENSDPDGRRWPRGKSRDDATAAFISF
ncbi:MAG TPA: protein phosphatase 2C domain-containing protein [Streptosporangiaceae bacterium]